ncbi:MAG TPA: acyltransferase family protein [Pseudonocardia sp.]|nr:acyltransferase family protein [Pseudonocardia sp.]
MTTTAPAATGLTAEWSGPRGNRAERGGIDAMGTGTRGEATTTPEAAAAEPPASGRSRVAWVDAAKGLSILLVVAHHCVWFLEASGQAPAAVVAVNSALASLRMPLFFLAAGLFVAAPLAAPWRTLLHKRVALFLYLYALWTVLRFTYFATVVPEGVDPDGSANPQVLTWALLVPGPSLWFLYALALFAVIGKLVRRAPVWLQLGASGVLSALAGAGVLQWDSFAWTFMARYLFFFLLGCHARQLIERLARSGRLLTVAAAGAACVVAAAGAVAVDIRAIPGVALLLNVVAVVFGVLFAAWIARHRIGTPLVALGRRTLPIYLVHMFWLAAVMAGVRHLDLPAAAAYAVPAVMTVVLVVLSLLTRRLLVKAGAPWLFALPSRLAYRAPERERTAAGESPAR